MRELILIDEPVQEFTTLLAGQRCSFVFRVNATNDAVSFDLKVLEDWVLYGRRVVLGVDLLAAYDFGIGVLFAVDYEGSGLTATLANLASRRVRLFQHDGDY